MSEHSRSAFADLFNYHLRKVGWTRGQLCAAAKVSDSQLSGWLSHKRPLGRDHVNRIVWALALAYRDNDNLERLDTFDALLNEFLEVAGFSAITGASDLVWNTLKGKSSAGQPLLDGDVRRVLHIGWVDYPFFSYRVPEQDDPQGLAVSIMNRVARLIGAVPDWVECKWETIIPKLQEREIDVVCPILIVLPSRLLQVQFTASIPGIDLSINGVLHRDHRFSSKRERDVSAVFVRGEVGEELCSLLVPEPTSFTVCTSLDEARKLVLNSPLNEDSVRCLVADHMMCQNLVEKNPRLQLLKPTPVRSEIQLPVAMAVHEREPRFLALLDSCLRLLEEASFFAQLYRESPDAAKLARMGVISPNVVKTQQSVRSRKKG